MDSKKGLLNPQSLLTLLKCYAEHSSIHGRWHIASSKKIALSQGIQYLLKRSHVTRVTWLILVILALMAASIFASNVFVDWKDERTITSLKTISKPVNELDFPSVTICKDGQNLQAVREVLEKEKKEWEGKRKKRESSGSSPGSDYCQLKFKRTCEQVVLSLSFRSEICLSSLNIIAT